VTYALGARIAVAVLLVFGTQLFGCSGPVFPSRGLTVRMNESGPSALEVKHVIATELSKQGFRDAINNQRAACYFKGPREIDEQRGGHRGYAG
jgi:hypothetical protein